MAEGQHSARPGEVVEFPKMTPAIEADELARLTPVDEAPQPRREPSAPIKEPAAPIKKRGRLRLPLMGLGVLVAAAAAGAFWLQGGRWVSTDDAYVRAAKLMVSTDISGLVDTVDVKQGQRGRQGPGAFHRRSRAVPDRVGRRSGATRVDQDRASGLAAGL